MSNLKMLSVLFTALVLSIGAGCATDDMDSSMHESDKGTMSGSMNGDMNESGSMEDSDHSDMSGSMGEDGSGMDESDSM